MYQLEKNDNFHQSPPGAKAGQGATEKPLSVYVYLPPPKRNGLRFNAWTKQLAVTY